MLLIRWLLTVFFAVVAVLVDTGNVAGAIIARKRGRNFSAVPIIGALCGVVACLLCPMIRARYLIPVAVVLDVSMASLAFWLFKKAVGRAGKPR